MTTTNKGPIAVLVSIVALVAVGIVLFVPETGAVADPSTIDRAAHTECGSGTDYSPFVDASGCIMLPRGFEVDWTHLGAWAIPGDEGEVHSVYTQSRTVDAFRRTGVWPDGAVLVKSVRAAENAALATGNAHWAGEQKIWFVMIKDTEGRFPDNPLWGEGWGWALFDASDRETNISTNYRTDCISCHIPRRDKDWVYIEGYPVLR